MDTGITFDELETLCEKMASQRGFIEELSSQKKQADIVLSGLEKSFADLLEKLGKTNYPSKFGTFGVTLRTSVRIPGSPEARTQFFDYLRGKGIFDNLVSVHSATLNSFYKEEMRAAEERGEDLTFQVPGIDPPTVTQIVSFRKS